MKILSPNHFDSVCSQGLLLAALGLKSECPDPSVGTRLPARKDLGGSVQRLCRRSELPSSWLEGCSVLAGRLSKNYDATKMAQSLFFE